MGVHVADGRCDFPRLQMAHVVRSRQALWSAAVPCRFRMLRTTAQCIGLVLFLHFGIFDLLALAWRCLGINAQPIMRAPCRATSLAEFWGRRWNTAFNTLAHQFIFRPVARRYGAINARIAVFLVSGVL